VDSPAWIVICVPKVNSFRQTLSPEEAELFNECLMQLCRNPHVDGIRKIKLPVGTPIVSLMYRGDDFVLIYYPTQVTKPFQARKITVLKAMRARDLD
jgi:hypothetical protein